MRSGAPLLDDEKLIDAVKCRPFMYNADDPQHNHRPLLFKSWKEIAQEVGHEVHTVKERWISMRDYYRKKLRELEKIKTGQLDKKFKKWSLYDKLDFLKPYLRHIELDTTSTPGNSRTGSRNDGGNDSEIDSDEEGVQLDIVKAENTDDDEDDNQSDDSYRRDVVQALDSGYGSLEPTGGKKFSKGSGQIRMRSIRRRAAYLDKDEPPLQASSPATKRHRSEWAPPAATKAVRLSPVTVEESSGEMDTNHHFFASLVPMIETLDPLTAMEFRHEVHGVLLRYLREERDKQKSKPPQVSNAGVMLVEQGGRDRHALTDGNVRNISNNGQSSCNVGAGDATS